MAEHTNCESFNYMANVLYEHLLNNPAKSFEINTDKKLAQTLNILIPPHLEDEFWFDYNMEVFKLSDFHECVLSVRKSAAYSLRFK